VNKEGEQCLQRIGLFFLAILTFSLAAGTVSFNASANSSIQEKIDAAKPGETVFVEEGIFFERLVINKSLKLIGEGHDKTVIDGEQKGTVIVISNVENVVIKGFKIRNSALGSGYGGIIVKNSRNVTIIDNNVTNCCFGIWCENMSDSRIEGNIVKRNFETAVTLTRSNNNKVCENEVKYSTPYGIYIHQSKNNIVKRNYVAYICQGIRLENSNDNEVAENFMEKNSPYGISIVNSYENNITQNSVVNNNFGIFLQNSERNFLEANLITFQSYGISLMDSSDNVLRSNNITGNKLYNFGVRGSELAHFIHDIDETNTVNGRPICYLVNEKDVRVPENAGFVAVVSSSNITAENLDLKENMYGIVLAYSKRVTIRNSSVHNNHGEGICLIHTNNCRIEGNTIETNIFGVSLENSWNNWFFHNNFIDNQQQVKLDVLSRNVWDGGFPCGGNYWSSYTGVDANEDGIGDTHTLNENNKDNHPLMGKIRQFLAFKSETERYAVKLVSNVTVSDFSFSSEEGKLEFKVRASGETLGFCRVSVPKTLLKAQNLSDWIVETENETLKSNVFEDYDNTYIYFQCEVNENAQTVRITTRKEFFLNLENILWVICISAFGVVVVLVLWKAKSKRGQRRN